MTLALTLTLTLNRGGAEPDVGQNCVGLQQAKRAESCFAHQGRSLRLHEDSSYAQGLVWR